MPGSLEGNSSGRTSGCEQRKPLRRLRRVPRVRRCHFQGALSSPSSPCELAQSDAPFETIQTLRPFFVTVEQISQP